MNIEERQVLNQLARMIERYDAQEEVLRTMQHQISEACREYEKISGCRGLSIDSIRLTLAVKGIVNA